MISITNGTDNDASSCAIGKPDSDDGPEHTDDAHPGETGESGASTSYTIGDDNGNTSGDNGYDVSDGGMDRKSEAKSG